MGQLIQQRIDSFTDPEKRIGATYVQGEGTFIRLWAPRANHVAIEWADGTRNALEVKRRGYFSGFFREKKPGDRYFFVLDNDKPIPDPASRFQPEGVFGHSEIVASDYEWSEKNWNGIPFKEWVIYEIHTGTFSESHDFSGIIADIPRLKKLGINAIEIMPVSQFTGSKNWGYDGVFPHAVQNTYGGPHGLKALVDACHRSRIAVILDVVYNHLGPEGNVLSTCGPYTHDKYSLPWGEAINFDDKESEEVRLYFLQTIWQWFTEFQFDGLRLDAVQNIFDNTAIPFLEEVIHLKKAAEKFVGRSLLLIAETDTNDSRIIKSEDNGWHGFDAQWADDFHHNLHALLTGEKDGYYEDYGSLEQQARIYKEGVAYSGQYSTYRKRRHGRSYENIDKNRLIVETQNHDQVGNRLRGRRLSALLDFKRLKLAGSCVLLSPFTPFIFMGEEIVAKSPFLYFIDYADEELRAKAQKKREEEWKDFSWDSSPPDPAAPQTFEKSILKIKKDLENPEARAMNSYYKELISLSKRLRQAEMMDVSYNEGKKLITLHYKEKYASVLVHYSFSDKEESFPIDAGKEYTCLLRSDDFQPEADKSVCVEDESKIPPFSVIVLQVNGEK